MSRLVVAIAVAVVAGRAVALWLLGVGHLTPDTGLYVTSGLALFPSPLGTLAGTLLGWHGLHALNAVAAGVLVVQAAGIARRLGGSPALAAGLAAVTPLGLWSMFAGVDALGSALLLAAAQAQLELRPRRAGAFAGAACLTHFAVVPLVLAGVALRPSKRPYRRAGLLVGLAALGAVAALLTPFRGVLASTLDPAGFLGWAGLTLTVAALPFLPWIPRLLTSSPEELRRVLAAAAVGTAVAAGLQGAGDPSGSWYGTKARYALPLTLLLCSGAAVRARRRQPATSCGCSADAWCDSHGVRALAFRGHA